ncbi:GntR family transcriptional regulator [Phyllobacterium phragmitis]|uniref:GntR family transcriptional regulator n=1 Tax=Phyllobacterium phragmitis TaxID=2670329 RepID=A0A2S9IVS0_9HYPH|nr:transcriptional regulator NanR [Phyllobacterium phragmitis]PRD44624.1 GntR family transcriptional regulator [Phyllobacterium phragmitis]
MTQHDERIVRRKLSDEVFDRLRDLIASGELGPGDLMPSERDLMERFGVGRPAIREAMQTLHNMGLIVVSHGERARVSELTARTMFKQIDVVARMLISTTPEALDHLKETRRFYERGLVRLAAERAGETDIRELEEILARQEGHFGDPRMFIADDLAFHRKIAAISGNPMLEALSESLLNWLFEYHTEMLIWTGKEKVTLREHHAILDCIRQKEPDAAETAMIVHIDRSGTLYSYPPQGKR